MINTLPILWHEKNKFSFNAVHVVDLSKLHPSTCARLIREGRYDVAYDLNQDGFLNQDDYNNLYNMWFGKWDAWHNGELGPWGRCDIRMLIRIKKHISKVITEYDADFDLDNDGHITSADLNIARNWLLTYDKAKLEKEIF